MEFTTPPSYGDTKVNVSGIAKDGEIICASGSSTAKHLTTSQDSENDWPEPKSVHFEWIGKTKEGKEVKAELAGDLGERLDRVDVLAHIPGIIKTIVGGVVGTKPYIYQVGGRPFSPLLPANIRQYASKDNLELKIKIGDKESTETGSLLCEATFIS